jgi:hypothetical protein
MLEIPGVNGEPTIKIFDNISELQKHCGEKLTHGYFDPRQNLIIATVASVAHEIGHYRDFKSGRMKLIPEELSSEERVRLRIRNEIVAILFAYQRVSDQYGLLPYEREMIEWIVFHWERSKPFAKWRAHAAHVSQLRFEEIQDLSDWLLQPEHNWGEKLRKIFYAYLKTENEMMTYRL